MNFAELRKDDKLITIDSIKLIDTCNDYIKKGTKLEVVARLENGDITVREPYCLEDFTGKVIMYTITKDDSDKIKVLSKYNESDVMEFTADTKLQVYRNEKSKGSVSMTFSKGTQIVIRSVTPRYYNCTVINGNYKGENITVVREIVDWFLHKLGNTIDTNFGEDIRKKEAETYEKLGKANCFKYGEEVVCCKTYVPQSKHLTNRLGEKVRFIHYLDKPVYTKDGIPLDCIISRNGGFTLANSNCFKKYKPNYCFKNHEITVKVKGNRVKYMDKVGNNECVGVSVCDSQDKFNLRTGLLLAIARAYNDKALEDFALDRFKD